MEITEHNFSAPEQKIRKQWLWLHLSLSCILPVTSLLLTLGLIGWDNRYGPVRSPEELAPQFFLFCIGTLKFWILYHCAYTKRGIKFLTFTIVMEFFSLLTEIWRNLTHSSIAIEELDLFPVTIVDKVIFFVILGPLTVWRFSLNLKMRSLNEKAKAALQEEKS